MQSVALFLLLATAIPLRAMAACPVDDPAKGIFAYPALMKAQTTFKDYEVRVFDSKPCDPSPFRHRSGVEILQAGRQVYAQTGYSFAIGYPLQDNQPPDSVKLKVGDDVTGEGTPDLLISEWSGGAHCCYTFHLFQLGGAFKKIQSIPLRDADESAFVTRPDVKGMLLNSYDYSAFAYFPSGFAGSPAGHVLLSFQGGRFRLDQAHLKGNVPKPDEIGHCAKLFKQSRDWKQSQPLGMWYYATDLIYTGNAESAWKFLDGAWGGDEMARAKYLREYRKRLQKSFYYQDLMQLQEAPASGANQKIDWNKQCMEYMHG